MIVLTQRMANVFTVNVIALLLGWVMIAVKRLVLLVVMKLQEMVTVLMEIASAQAFGMEQDVN